MREKQIINNILIKLTDVLGYSDTPEQLEAFLKAETDLQDIVNEKNAEISELKEDIEALEAKLSE